MRKVAMIVSALLVSALLVGIVHATVTSSDADNRKFKTKTMSFSGEAISMAFVNTGVVTSAGVKISQWPAGIIALHGAVLKDVVVTVTATNNISAATAGDLTVGTVTASGSDLTGTEANIIPKTAMNTMTNPVSAYLASPAPVDGSSTAAGVYVNLMIDADSADTIHTNAMTVAGTLQILYSEMLDY